jgi:O-antigen/teichoic acid export membrane protein
MNDDHRLKPSIHHLIRDIAVYGAGNLILKATAFFTIPIYTRIFTPGEYGMWSFIATAIGLLNSILVLGGDSAYDRFFFEAKTKEGRRLVTSTWFGFLALWSVGWVVLCLPFSGLYSVWSFGTKGYGLLFILTLLASPLTLINSMCGQALRNRFQARLFTTMNVVSTLLIVGFSLIGAVVMKLGLVGLLGGTLFATLVILPIRLWTVRDLLRPVFSVKVLRDLLMFGAPLIPSSLAYWVFAMSDRILLGKLSTLEQVGLYTVANQVTIILVFFHGALGQAWSPHAIRVYEEQPEQASVFFGRVMTYILAGFGLLSVGITTFSHEILMVLSTPPFYAARLAIGPLALGFVAYGTTQVTALGISLKKKTHYFALFSWAAALLNVGLNVLLIPIWGMIAASWTTMATYLFLTLVYLTVSQRLWSVAYETRRALVLAGLTFIFTIGAPLLPAFSPIFSVVIKSVYCCVFVGLMFLLKGLDNREWETLLTLIRGRSLATRLT